MVPRAVGRAREDAVPFTFYPETPGNSTRYPGYKAGSGEVSVIAGAPCWSGIPGSCPQ